MTLGTTSADTIIPRKTFKMDISKYKKIASLKTASDFQAYLNQLGIELPFDSEIRSAPDSPLSHSLDFDGKIIGNRFCALPMEGWDADLDGKPSELTERRWKRFGISGAKLIWGGEACAVCPEGKGNPRQLEINKETAPSIANLRKALVNSHEEKFHRTDDLLVGLQLTHSGRFSRPDNDHRLKPKILYHHPLLDRRLGLPGPLQCLGDEEIEKIIQDFISAAVLSVEAGFDFVDIKHCHGYLGHEFLSAYTRSGRYGGSFENRTRFLREVVQGICQQAPNLGIAVRVSIFDFIPFCKDVNGIGEPEEYSGKYPYAFGGDGTGVGIDLSETKKFLDLLKELRIKLVCATAGSPYYNPHVTRPAMFPPSDGYFPPEDPLVGVSRQIQATAELKKKNPDLIFVGSGYTYLQEWLPHVAQSVIESNQVDLVGLGRMMLSYPDIVDDLLNERNLNKKHICRTFSDCTTASRKGLISGCYPLDPFYQERPESKTLRQIKKSE